MTGDCHVRFLESVGVKSPCATYPNQRSRIPQFGLGYYYRICKIGLPLKADINACT